MQSYTGAQMHPSTARLRARMEDLERTQGPLANRIRARLEELERNQSWLARKLGLSISTVYRWLICAVPIPARRLPQIAAVLGLTVEELTVPAVAA